MMTNVRIRNHLLLYITGWWFQTFFMFDFIYGIILPIDFHIFHRGCFTTNQIMIYFLEAICRYVYGRHVPDDSQRNSGSAYN